MINVIEVQGLIDAIKDITGIKGDTGATPDITITATADALSSDNPSVTVTKTGTAEAPSFALAFSGLKGAAGAGGVTTFGGTTAEGTIFSSEVGNIIQFSGNDVSNIANLEVGDAVVQIYNNESYIYTIFEMPPNKSDAYCVYDNRVKLAGAGSGSTYYAPTQVLSLNAYPITESHDYMGFYDVIVKSIGTAEEKKIKPGYIVVADIVINDSGITTIKNNVNITPYVFESGVTNGTLLFPALANLRRALNNNCVITSDEIAFTNISAINIYYA